MPSFECAWLGVSGLVVTALTFIVAAIRANPGCEITALPHLVLPPRLES